jgi:hypothetical protein
MAASKLPSFETQAVAQKGDGLLLRMRAESVETIAFMESVNYGETRR